MDFDDFTNEFLAENDEITAQQPTPEGLGGAIGARRIYQRSLRAPDPSADVTSEGYHPLPPPPVFSEPLLAPPITTLVDEDEEEVAEEEEEEDKKCPICIRGYSPSIKGTRAKIECPICKYTACSKCVVIFYSRVDENAEKPETFPSCMKCKNSWELSFSTITKTVRTSIVENALKRILNTAVLRERSLLPASMTAASVYKTRRLCIEVCIQQHNKLTSCLSNMHVARLTGGAPDMPGSIRSLFSFLSHELEVISKRLDLTQIPDIVKHCLAEVVDASPETGKGRGFLFLMSFVLGVQSKNHLHSVVPIVTEAVLAFKTLAGGITVSPEERKRLTGKVLIRTAEYMRILQRAFSDFKEPLWFSLGGIEIAAGLNSLVASNYYLENYNSRRTRSIVASPEAISLAGSDYRGGVFAQGACVVKNCRGFVFRAKRSVGPSEVLECRVCRADICANCKEPINSNLREAHRCDPDSVASVKTLEAMSRPCPKCAIPIVRTEGCRHMFCTVCKQPYDWETLETHVSNTNPEYYSWIQQQQSNTGVNRIVSADSAAEMLRTVFSPNVRGDDGFTTRERLTLLAEAFSLADFATLAAIARAILNVEENIVSNLIQMIPPPSEFDKYRVSYILRNITELEWVNYIQWYESHSTYLQCAVIEINKFSRNAIDIIKIAYSNATTHPIGSIERKIAEFGALRETAKSAVDASSSFSEIFIIFGLTKNRAKSRALFNNANSYWKAVAHAENTNIVRDSILSDTLQNTPISYLCGGKTVIDNMAGQPRDTEMRRVSRILQPVSVDSITEWVRNAYADSHRL
jgi:hypothetical protein